MGKAQRSLYLGMSVCSLGCENTFGIQNRPHWASWLALCPRRTMSVAWTRMRGFARNFWQIASDKTCIYEFLRAHSPLWHEIFFLLDAVALPGWNGRFSIMLLEWNLCGHLRFKIWWSFMYDVPSVGHIMDCPRQIFFWFSTQQCMWCKEKLHDPWPYDMHGSFRIYTYDPWFQIIVIMGIILIDHCQQLRQQQQQQTKTSCQVVKAVM